MKQIFGKTAASISTLFVSGQVFAHVGEHGESGLLAGLMHLLAEHGYLSVLALCGIGALILRRARRL